jgi:hypothetical protein
MYSNPQLTFALDNQKKIEEEKKFERRLKMVEHLLSSWEKGSEWLIKENLKLLFFYKDFSIVINAVNEFRTKTNSEYLLNYINQFLDGSLDVSDITEMQDRLKQLREERQSYINKRLLSESDIKAQARLDLLKTCQNSLQTAFVNSRNES